jgi:cullin 1
LDDNDSNKLTLDVYQEFFEKPFIEATDSYYRAESDRFIKESSVTDYMKRVSQIHDPFWSQELNILRPKVENRLKEEEHRLQMYLHESTSKPVNLTTLFRMEPS